jgi:outer membrane receptor protein involved in Fe transport
VTGEHAEQSTPIVHARGAEVGLRTVRIPGVQSTVTLGTLGFDAELLFVGDAGTTEAGRPSRRWGIEWTNYARPHPWMTLDFDLSFSRARFTDEDPAGDRVPGALDRVISGGVTIEEPEGGVFGSLRSRHFGPRPLIEDSSVQSKATTLVNGEVGYQFSRHLRLVAGIFNLFDSEVSDIAYFYTSRLPGEPLEGVDDIHTHTVLPRGVRVGLQFSF